MKYLELSAKIQEKGSFLCVGLDSDIQKLPDVVRKEADPQFEFNKQIIDATAPHCVAYKPNIAFYEAQGINGWKSLEKTVDYIRSNYPNQFLIADAKRGDIGNTSKLYARTFFETFDFDAVTVAPYMGSDSVEPFLGYSNKWVILLALTSNKGASDFQYFTSGGGEQLYQKVICQSMNWANHENMMYVVGATKAEMMSGIRELVPDHFLLVPGVGAQGGSLEDVYTHGKNKNTGLLVNASRSVIFASANENYSQEAAKEAKALQSQMNRLL